MAIDQRVINAPVGTPAGTAARLAELQRQIRQLASARGVVGAGTITGNMVATGTITASNIVSGTITAELIEAGAINATHIAANSIDTHHLMADSVTGDKIAANTITAANIAAGTITAGEIAAGTITSTQIAANTITANEIAANAITTSELNANSVTSAKIAANQVTATHIAANTITSGQIAANTITANEIAANAITSSELAADAVTAAKIDVANLAAISTDMGNLTAGTITGGTIQTAPSGSRVVINSTGLKGYASDGTTVNIDFNTGSGVLTAKGVIIADAGSQLPAALITGDIGGGNIAPNSGFENATNYLTGYAAGGTGGTATAETTITRTPGTSVKITNTSGAASDVNLNNVSARPPAVPGKNYVNSAWVYSPSGGTFRMYVYGYTTYTSGGAIGGGGANFATLNTVVPAATWTRIYSPVLAMASDSISVRTTVMQVGAPAGAVFYVDDVQTEMGDKATSYAPKVDEILPSTVGTNEIAAGAVTTAKMTANTINGNVITSNTLDAAKITAGTITATQIGAGAVTASAITAGAIQAQHLSVAMPNPVALVNGTFNSPVVSGAVPGWLNSSSPGLTTVADARFGNVVQNVDVADGSYFYQDVSLPVGRHVWRFWHKIVAAAAGQTAISDAVITSGTATFTQPTSETAAGDWKLKEGIVEVTAEPTVVRFRHRISGTGSGMTIQYANSHLVSSITTTEIAPGQITTGHITTNTLSGGVIQAGTLDALKIVTNSLTSTQIKAGAITADRLNITTPSVNARNGNFQEDPTALPGWTSSGTAAFVSEADTTWGKAAKLSYNGTVSAPFIYQDIAFPVGRHVVQAWVKTAALAGTTGATITMTAATGSGTVGVAPGRTLGTTDWKLLEISVQVGGIL